MKLTDVQRNILHAVVLQANKPVVELAKALGYKEHIVRRTIASLLDSGVFLRRSVWVDPHVLGLSHYVVYLVLPLQSISYRQQFLQGLVSLEEACSVAELGGEGLFQLCILARGRDHVDEALQDLAAKFPFPFRIQSCSIVLESDYSGTSDGDLRNYAADSLYFGPLSPNASRFTPDEKDHEVLSALANHMYLNLQNVARFLSIPAATLQYRIERLERAGVIKGHYYVMDPKVFNEIPMCLQVKSRVLSKKERLALRVFCRNHPRIGFITFFLGEYTCEICTLVQEHRQALRVIDELSARFGNILESIHITPQISFAKYSLYPLKKRPSPTASF